MRKRVIFKYLLTGQSSTFIVTKYHHFLSAQIQDGKVAIWLLIDKEQPLEEVTFELIPTGQEIDVTFRGYLATVQIDGLVWHIFQNLSKQAESIFAKTENNKEHVDDSADKRLNSFGPDTYR